MKRLANAGLTLMLLGLMTMALALAVFPAVTGTKAVAITANSMQAVLPLGTEVYIKKQDTYITNDIVTFPWSGTYVTHQLVGNSINPATGKMDPDRWVTKGTSNAAPDPWTVKTGDIEGRVAYQIPYAGTTMKVLSYPVVWVFLGLLAFALYYISTRKEGKEISEEPVMAPKPKWGNDRDFNIPDWPSYGWYKTLEDTMALDTGDEPEQSKAPPLTAEEERLIREYQRAWAHGCEPHTHEDQPQTPA
jgi:signal peptidase